jgi:hypothetical protein
MRNEFLQCEERETIYECPLLITHGSMRITHSSAAKISGNVFLNRARMFDHQGSSVYKAVVSLS